MISPFDHERILPVSPGLASTIGLEEACLFAALSELADIREPDQQQFWSLNQQDQQKRLPFFSDLDLERVSKSLAAKGLIHIASAPFQQSGVLLFCFVNQQGQSNSPSHFQNAKPGLPIVSTGPRQAAQAGATLIAPNWQPDSDTLQRLRQMNVDEHFARAQIPEFVTFWRDSGESHKSWSAKFINRVIHKWRERETFTHQRDQMRPIDFNWRPSHEAMEMMIKHAGITPQFVEDAIPEFILYWHEKGTSADTWNTKFIQHVRRQWARFQSSVVNDANPQIIADNWQPSADVFDILGMANIDMDFARRQLPEFVLYWKETKQAHSSWNTKFLQHVKYHWAQQHKLQQKTLQPNSATNGQQPRSTRERSLVEDLTDTSW
ncbi:DnaT-like ssDNA-binding domain-containing protein [Pseudoteredinibacter isoporae]|uniref:DnaT-like ssDNA-binding domain-containing protein n=1 Tax=Pseudoteredinibacter isoporae TaxID=570281 RepID=UPI00310553D7